MRTPEELKSIAVKVGQALFLAKEIPSGHLYAMLMGELSLDEYTEIITILKKAGLVEEKHFLLSWIDKT